MYEMAKYSKEFKEEALSHVAKKLIRLIYTLETTNQPFDANKLRS